MKVLDAEFAQGFFRMCGDGFDQGWHERNGGNLSYRMKPEEVEEVKDDLGTYEGSVQDGTWPGPKSLRWQTNTSWSRVPASICGT